MDYLAGNVQLVIAIFEIYESNVMKVNNLTLFFRIFWHTKTALQKLCPIFGVQFCMSAFD